MSQGRKPVAAQLDWALGVCRQKGLRKTRALRAILSYLLRDKRPLNWTRLVEEPGILRACDPSSVYRILAKLESIGLVRRLGSPDRSYFYTLNLPGEHHDFLICTECGHIESLEGVCPVGTLERRIARRRGYRNVRHELEFFGVCPRCQRN